MRQRSTRLPTAPSWRPGATGEERGGVAARPGRLVRSRPVNTPSNQTALCTGLQLGAVGSLVLLCLINLTNYIDRYLVSALGELIKIDLKLTDEDIGWLLSVFVLV